MTILLRNWPRGRERFDAMVEDDKALCKEILLPVYQVAMRNLP
jgi:hypothetical protein